MSEDKQFLDRWSRQKAAAKTKKKDETPASNPVSSPARSVALPESPPTIDPETLPDIDGMDADSDFSPFMQDGVPEALRNRALRKLWQADPAFNVVDGLVEYGEDYTSIAAIAETVENVYKVGKGILDESGTMGQTETAQTVEHADQTEDATPTKLKEQDDLNENSNFQKTNSQPETAKNTKKL